MKCSTAITSFLAALAAVQGRPHFSNGDTIDIEGGQVNLEIKSPVESLDIRGIAISQSTTDDCTDSSTVPPTTSTAQGVATLPSPTEDCTETSGISSITPTAQGVVTLARSTEDCTQTSPVRLSASTTRILLTSKKPLVASTAQGVFTVLSSESSSIALESNVDITFKILLSSTVTVTNSFTAPSLASTFIGLLSTTVAPSVTSSSTQSEVRANGTVVSSAQSSILAVSTIIQLTTSTLIPTHSPPVVQSQTSVSSNEVTRTIATVSPFITLTNMSTTTTSTVTLATASTPISQSSLQPAPGSSSQVNISTATSSSAEVSTSTSSSILGAPSLLSIETTTGFGSTLTLSFTQPKVTSSAPTLATSPEYLASSLPAAGICACIAITMTTTSLQTDSTPTECPCSTPQAFLTPGSKPTVSLPSPTSGPDSYCTSASLPGLVGLQLNCSSWTTSVVTSPSSTFAPASAAASSTQVPEMPRMGNYSSAPTPSTITPSSLAITPLGNATGAATHMGGTVRNGFKHMVTFLVSFLALVVFF